MCQNDLFCARQKYIYALICNKKLEHLKLVVQHLIVL